jgi:hypothetical protein
LSSLSVLPPLLLVEQYISREKSDLVAWEK